MTPRSAAPAADLSTMEVVEQTGASYRQLDYWARQGVLVPAVEAAGSGTARRYTKAQARAACALARLSKLGMHGDVFASVGAELVDTDLSGVVVVDHDGRLHPFADGLREGWLIDLGPCA